MSENTLKTTDDQNDDQLAVPNEVVEVPETPGFDNPELKDIGAVSEDHHAVQEVGKAAMEKNAGTGAGKFIAENIYESDKAWVREWLQNEEAACVRAAKMFIRFSDEYDNDWLTLTKWVDDETGETVKDYDEPNEVLANYGGDPAGIRKIAVPRPIDQVIEAARSLGYDPTIVWDVFHDERKIITVDNGDGMTPTEFDKYFNSPFESLSDEDGETGGMYGVGSESAAILHGEDGGMECEIRSRKPDENGNVRKGFRAYSYLGGGNFLPGEVEDGFIGSRFKIPVQDSFDLTKVQDWVEKYAEKLRVPLLYREHDAGSTPVEEEYEATNFFDDYDDPPVQIEKPGEYSVVAGPDVLPYTSYREPDPEDTFLVSMPVDRNTRASISTFWDVVIQIHDEQGRIVAGPNRGEYAENVKLQENDIRLPEPTGDRDRLSRDSEQKEFFYHIEEVVKAEEISQVSEIAEEMKKADHPADAILDEESDWTLFKKMVKYHGSRRTTNQKSKFKKFINNRDEFPDFDKETITQIYSLFQEIEHCNSNASRSSRKSNRRETKLGNILADTDPESVYMAASTGGNFSKRFKVVKNTNPDAEIIVISSASKYDKWSEQFGFKILKEVPLKHSTDGNLHDYDVPDSVHKSQVNKASSNSGKSDKVLDRALKIRTDDDNSSIDLRLSIEDAQQRLENGNCFHGHRKLVLFPNGQDHENISDHYDMAKYAAIASVSKTEYDELADYDHVLTYEEFTEWSRSALIATEDGAVNPHHLIGVDKMVVLAYRDNRDPVTLLADENEELRRLYCEDIRDQYGWASALDGYDGGYNGDDVGEVPDDEKDDTLFAVAGDTVLSRAEWAFDQIQSEEQYNDRDITGLKLSRNKYGYHNPAVWKTLEGSASEYQLMVDTPNWDNDSDVYELMPTRRDNDKAQMYLGFHDLGIDPSEKSSDELRRLINQR